MISITSARLCKPAIVLAVALAGCASHKRVAVVPTCGATLIAPKGCKARAWGNAVEVDCPGEQKIYICNKLEHPSPTK